MTLLDSPSVPFIDSPPSYKEVATAINKCKNGASACPFDQLSILILKRCPILLTLLHSIIVNCLESKAHSTLLETRCNNPHLQKGRYIGFRRTSGRSHYNLYGTRFLLLQWKQKCKTSYSQTITLIRRHKRVSGRRLTVLEHTEMLSHLIKDAKRHSRSLVVTLLDLRNAFGEISHDPIHASMEYHHLPNPFKENIQRHLFRLSNSNHSWKRLDRPDRNHERCVAGRSVFPIIIQSLF